MGYIPLREAVKRLGLHKNTLRKYADNGSIPSIRNPAGQRLFDVEAYLGASFLTLFTENSFGWIGTGDIGRIQRLCYYLDDLISRLTLAQAKQRRRLKKAADRLRLRIRHLI